MSEPQLLRAILHVDMDAFYASVEQLDHPEFRGKPVVVGGSPEARGVVSAASYEARKYGVHSAMPMAQALRICPNGVFLPVRMERYRQVSRAIRDILEEYTDLVEPISLDEAFLDVSGSLRLFGSAVAIGRAIKSRIKRDIGLTASVGVAGNKLLAKLASDHDKPDGFVVIDERETMSFLADLPIEKLWGVGPATMEQLGRMGISRIGQLQRWSKTDLQRRFGQAHGAHLFDVCRGIDHSAVISYRQAKSISNENTFAQDTTDQRELQRQLMEHCESVASRLRSAHLLCRTVTLKVRFADFETITRTRTLLQPSDDDGDLYNAALALFQRAVPASKPVRLLGVGVSQLSLAEGMPEQLFLFDEEHLRRNELNNAVDRIREKFGVDSVRHGRALSSGPQAQTS